jgi:hypothetical protein
MISNVNSQGKELYKCVKNPHTEKGRTQLLVEKRNKQFHDLFLKIKDPISIIQFYSAIKKVYEKHLGDEDKADQWLKVLTYVYDKSYFWTEDIQGVMGLTPQQSDSILKRMGKRHMLIIEKKGAANQYSLSADGYLFLKNFSKDCITAMMKVVRNGRTGRKKITSTKKIKKVKK